jgi:hypothetical protein
MGTDNNRQNNEQAKPRIWCKYEAAGGIDLEHVVLSLNNKQMN